MNLPLIRAEALDVALGPAPILHALSFGIDAGGVTALIGPNGSGKTTLLKTIGGLLDYQGSLAVDGREVRDWPAPALALRIAFVRQTALLTFAFTVREFVGLGRTPHTPWLAREGPADRHRVEQALHELDLLRLADADVTRLSGGEQQRLFLAQALAQDTDILLLDEPTLHLDLYHQYDLMERLRALAAAGRTVVAVVHDLGLAARYADRILVLHDGCVCAQGAPEDVLTPALIRTVFRLDADVTHAGAHGLSIRFHHPVPHQGLR